MTVMVLVNIKPASIEKVGTAGRLHLVASPDLDKDNPTPEQLEILATFAWVIWQNLWDDIESITWRDGNNVVHNLENPMLKRRS